MVDAARGAVEARCFPGLKKVRILRYNVQALVFYSLDVIAGKEVEVPDGVAWDDVDWEDRLEVGRGAGLTFLDGNGVLVGGEMNEVVVGIPSASEVVMAMAVPATLTTNVTAHG